MQTVLIVKGCQFITPDSPTNPPAVSMSNSVAVSAICSNSNNCAQGVAERYLVWLWSVLPLKIHYASSCFVVCFLLCCMFLFLCGEDSRISRLCYRP